MNTSLDPSTIPSNQLVQGDNIVFGVRGSRKKREGIDLGWDSGTTGSASLIGMQDFWFGTTSRTQRMVAVLNDKKVHSYSSGTKSADLFAGTAWGSDITSACLETINNLCVIAVDGTSNVMKKWSGSGNIADLGGTPPQASFCRMHLGRLWTNDKTNLDRLHYCTTGNPEEWTGTGDSGAIDIGIGDGDPEGITAIISFKRTLFVFKRTKLYRITNFTPETFAVEMVSSGVGCSGPNALVTVDQDDVYFVSDKGVHSLKATDAYGDFEGSYVSQDIQGSFNTIWTRSRLKYVWAGYLNSINSIAFAMTDSTYGSTANNAIWLYNFPLKSWYRWGNISCQSLIVSNDADKRRFYLGGATSRIAKTFTGTKYDLSTADAQVAIPVTIKTGFLYLDEDPETVKAFKKFTLFYKPEGTHTITVMAKIDNQDPQTIAFSQTNSTALLGSTFVLGSSVLGSDSIMAPYSQSIDGIGRSVQITISQTGIDQTVEIQGFGIEFEPAGDQQEVNF